MHLTNPSTTREKKKEEHAKQTGYKTLNIWFSSMHTLEKLKDPPSETNKPTESQADSWNPMSAANGRA